MKLIELKCTSCNGTLKIDEKNPHIAICEYCNATYLLEEDKENGSYLGQKAENLWYIPREPSSVPTKKTGWEFYGWKRMLVGCSLGFIIVFTTSFLKFRNQKKSVSIPIDSIQKEEIATTAINPQQSSITGVLAFMIETVYGKEISNVTEEELSRFQWLEMCYSTDSIYMGYSFSDPSQTKEEELIWISFPKDNAQVSFEELNQLKGLKKININSYLTAEALRGLSLIEIGCYSKSFQDLADIIEKPSQIKKISIKNNIDSLNGIQRFKNVSSLSLDAGNIHELDELALLKSLISLTLKDCNAVSDFTVLSSLSNLEKLSIQSETLRSANFLSGLPNLRSLTLIDTRIYDLSILKKHTNLTSLTIKDCDELMNLDVLSKLTKLRNLSIELPYECPKPALSTLTKVINLEISNFNSTTFLQNLTALETLQIESCSIDDPSAFSALENLNSISCSSLSLKVEDWEFISNIPHLKTLNLNNLSTYKDISSLFNISGLETLLLNGAECEIDFSKLQPNQSLTTLNMDGILLYKNVSISGVGIVSVSYDKVKLSEHIEFLSNYPNLKELSIADNKLTSLNFAASLSKLELLNIQKNYITNLKPLSKLKALKIINCKENPIENYKILKDSITIIKE